MRQPFLEDLMKIVENKYALVVIAAKRARVINEESRKSEADEGSYSKPVTMALEEIHEGKLDLEFPNKKKTTT